MLMKACNWEQATVSYFRQFIISIEGWDWAWAWLGLAASVVAPGSAER